jgi:hypothetical protein
MLSGKHGGRMSDEATLRRLRYYEALRDRIVEMINRVEHVLGEIQGVGIDLTREAESMSEGHRRMLEKLDAQIANEKAKLSNA